jgi:LasA protease
MESAGIMGRMLRWAMFSGVCTLCVMTACTRPVPGRGPRVHTPTEQSLHTGLVGDGPTPTKSVPSGSSQLLQTTNPANHLGTPAPAASPSPAFPGVYSGVPTPDVTPTAQFEGRSVGSYTVRSGDVVGAIAAKFDCTVEEIVTANGLTNADSVYVGQSLVIPITATRTGRDMKLVPDSELVYGPAYIHFDLAEFVQAQGGYLSDYSERVEGRVLTGADIVQLVSERFSVGPRVLLALLELRSGWVTSRHVMRG